MLNDRNYKLDFQHLICEITFSERIELVKIGIEFLLFLFCQRHSFLILQIDKLEIVRDFLLFQNSSYSFIFNHGMSLTFTSVQKDIHNLSKESIYLHSSYNLYSRINANIPRKTISVGALGFNNTIPIVLVFRSILSAGEELGDTF